MGTSESIYEDLKFVRQAGGFVMARNEDLAGTMAALTASDAKAADSHFILAKARLREAAESTLQDLISSDHAGNLQIGAHSLNRLLLAPAEDQRSTTRKRADTAREYSCSIDTLRSWEDRILLVVAEKAFATLPSKPSYSPSDTPLDTSPAATPQRSQASRGRVLALITGTSGTGVHDALDKVATTLHIPYLQLETFAVSAFGRHIDDLRYASYSSGDLLLRALDTPFPILEGIWQEAFVDFSTAVTEHLDRGSDLIIAMHATYLHAKSQSIASLIPAHLFAQNAWRPERVIQLVDDVYDSFARLTRAKTGLFHSDYQRGFPVVTRILQLLQWREAETLATRNIAHTLNYTPFYLFAVKQPIATFKRLLDTEPANCVYLSHPIDRVATGKASRPSSLRKDIDAITDQLRRASNLVVFEPTAVDELRFRPEAMSGNVFQLRPRWVSLRDPKLSDTLWSPLSTTEAALAEQPFVTGNRRTNPDKQKRRRARGQNKASRPAIDPPDAIHVLTPVITRHIKARDLLLVEQCRHVLAIRPFGQSDSEGTSLGRYAGGVLLECQHQLRLAELSTVSRRTLPFVVHVRPDELARRKQAMITAITREILEDSGTKPAKLFSKLVRAAPIDATIDSLPFDGLLRGEVDPYEFASQVESQVFPKFPAGKQPFFGSPPPVGAMAADDHTALHGDDLSKAGLRILKHVQGDTIPDASTAPQSLQVFSECNMLEVAGIDPVDVVEQFRRYIA